VQFEEHLQELAERLAYITEANRDDSNSYEAARAIEALCMALYRHEAIEGTGWLPGVSGDSRVLEREIIEPRTPDAATLVPLLGDTHVELATNMLSKTTLYSELSVVVTPMRIEDVFLRYSGGDRRDYRGVYSSLFSHNRRYHSLVSAGRCVFLPRVFRSDEESAGGSWWRHDYVAPLHQNPNEMTYLPTNPKGVRLGVSPFQDLFIYERLLLPYFPGAELVDVATISQKETDSFLRFNRYLTKKLGELDSSQSANDVRDIIDEIKYGAAELRIEARKLAKSKLLRNAQLGYFGVTIAALLTLDVGLVKEIAGVSGSVNLLQLLQSEFGIRKHIEDLSKSDFYVPYILSR
jgi:hypothetical protein